MGRMNDASFRATHQSDSLLIVKPDYAATHPHEAIAPPGTLYIPSLDGIRAVSFFLVFFSHAGFGDVVPGGFGVGIFFLLSGFLITTLLRVEFDRCRRISLGSFYLRRVLRILPPLYVTMIFATFLTILGGGVRAIPFAGTVAQTFQVSNFYQIWAPSPKIMAGTGVLWSLSVEEHFYLIFPLLYIWMCSRIPNRTQAVILLAGCAIALAWRCILRLHFHVDAIRTNFGTDTRFDSILFGCLFAVIANPVLRDPLYEWLQQRIRWFLPTCVVMLLSTFLYRSESFRETFRYTLQGISLIPLFIAAIRYQKSWPVLLLNLPFVRFLGVLSYTLYLSHAVFLAGFDHLLPSQTTLSTILALLSAFCFATLVHYLVERPCTRLRRRLSKSLKA